MTRSNGWGSVYIEWWEVVGSCIRFYSGTNKICWKAKDSKFSWASGRTEMLLTKMEKTVRGTGLGVNWWVQGRAVAQGQKCLSVVQLADVFNLSSYRLPSLPSLHKHPTWNSCLPTSNSSVYLEQQSDMSHFVTMTRNSGWLSISVSEALHSDLSDPARVGMEPKT